MQDCKLNSTTLNYRPDTRTHNLFNTMLDHHSAVTNLQE